MINYEKYPKLVKNWDYILSRIHEKCSLEELEKLIRFNNSQK